MSGEITEKSSASRFKGYQSAMQEYLLSHQVQLLEGNFTYKSGFDLAYNTLNQKMMFMGLYVLMTLWQ